MHTNLGRSMFVLHTLTSSIGQLHITSYTCPLSWIDIYKPLKVQTDIYKPLKVQTDIYNPLKVQKKVVLYYAAITSYTTGKKKKFCIRYL